MSTIKISQLPSATLPFGGAANTFLLGVQDGTSVKIETTYIQQGNTGPQGVGSYPQLSTGDITTGTSTTESTITVTKLILAAQTWATPAYTTATLPQKLTGLGRVGSDLYVGNGANTFIAGYKMPQNSQTTNYTLVLEDSGKHIYHPASDAFDRTITIPSNTATPFQIGTTIVFINDNPTNIVNIAITLDTLVLAGTGNTASPKKISANGMATAIKVGNQRWIISGTNIS